VSCSTDDGRDPMNPLSDDVTQITTPREVRVAARDATLSGVLAIPTSARGIVLFAHGSGSSRLSPRNVFVARVLQRSGIATLLFDLLTPDEERRDAHTGEHRFDIALLAQRLVDASRWVDAHDALHGLPMGYFGASTGSAAALIAAATPGVRAAAVVSRGGRPDLAGDETLAQVRAATLLIVGGRDDVVIELNERAYARLQCEKDFAVVADASHLFDEPGTLEEVAALAARWFGAHLTADAGHPSDARRQHAVR
jgi:putative phosphoribosyl transferase